MQGADCVPCSVPFYVRDFSICGFVYLGEQSPKTYPPTPLTTEVCGGSAPLTATLFKGPVVLPADQMSRRIIEDTLQKQN